ncbi:MAG: ricin-type beta-trefoil lectin domain protein [Terriglobia bacterium]
MSRAPKHCANDRGPIDRRIAGVLSITGEREPGWRAASRGSRRRSLDLPLMALALIVVAAASALGARSSSAKNLAATPPMGWNDWAHYQCGYTAQTILANAKALVSSDLAARGYRTVTIDDCWMQRDRDASGNLQADPQRFPQGIKPVSDAIHALGLKFGIYEDSGSFTCGRFAGSGQPKGGGKDHFRQDARLFASWGVDYLKLDGCNVYVPQGSSTEESYRKAYAAESAALKSVGRPIVFSESAPAYFQGTPDWYDVLSWVRQYGQLWREGSDVSNYYGNRPPRRRFRAMRPRRSRFDSVLWNYSYNLPLGRFQKPGNWNDADFIIGGDSGLSLAETRSQIALWSMMSAPLILSSDVSKLSPQAIAVLGNRAIISVDQDSLGRMATLVRRSPATDVLFKALSGGEDAVAVLNRSAAPVRVELRPSDFGFAASSGCRLDARDLWSGTDRPGQSALDAEVAAHDTAIWRIRASGSCGRRVRTGAVILTNNTRHYRGIDGYSRCLAAPGSVETCTGASTEGWTITPRGALRSHDGRCLAVVNGKPAMQACRRKAAQRWRYTLIGNLVSAAGEQCLSAAWPGSDQQNLDMQPCGHNQPNQVWSLPN